jgi:hypothetical protein
VCGSWHDAEMFKGSPSRPHWVSVWLIDLNLKNGARTVFSFFLIFGEWLEHVSVRAAQGRLSAIRVSL